MVGRCSRRSTTCRRRTGPDLVGTNRRAALIAEFGLQAKGTRTDGARPNEEVSTSVAEFRLGPIVCPTIRAEHVFPPEVDPDRRSEGYREAHLHEKDNSPSHKRVRASRYVRCSLSLRTVVLASSSSGILASRFSWIIWAAICMHRANHARFLGSPHRLSTWAAIPAA